MLKRGKKLGIILTIGIITSFLLSIVIASFEVKSSSIDKIYEPGNNIRGTLKIQFNEEIAKNKFSGLFNSSTIIEKTGLTLKEVLDKNKVNYTCDPANCRNGYESSNGQLEKNFILNSGEEKILGFKMEGLGVDFTSLDFIINVTNELSCKNPLQIDVFNDGIFDWEADNTTQQYDCNTDYGCYSAPSPIDTIIGEKPYCEKITLPISKKFKIGAWIKKGSTPYREEMLTMTLYSLDKEWLDDCNLPDPSTDGGLVGCEIEDYENYEEQEAYVCLEADTGTDYVTKKETYDPCGFFDYVEDFDDEFVADYYLFVSTPKFGDFGYAKIEDMDYEVEDYLLEAYNNSCTTGCIIPIRLSAEANANITIKDLNLRYDTSSGSNIEKNIYALEEKSLVVSSNNVTLNLETAEIKVPSIAGKYDFELYLENEMIDDEKIEVEKYKVLQYLHPKYAVLINPTDFTVILGKNISISKYTWDFGDGTILETTTSTATHTYNSSGIFKINIKALSSGNTTSTGSFDIIVGTAKDSIDLTIEVYQDSLNNVDSQILSLFPEWAQKEIKPKIIGNITNQLLDLKKRSEQAATAAEQIAILQALYGMKVPNNINIFAKGSLPYYPSYSGANMANFKELGAGETASSDSLARWFDNHVSLELEFEMINVNYENMKETLGGLFNLKVIPKQPESIKNFIVIEGNVKVNPGVTTKKLQSAEGLTYDSLSQREIKFLQYGIENFYDAKIFIAPEFSQLEKTIEILPGFCNDDSICDSGESWLKCGDCNNRLIITLLVLVILFGVGVGIFMMWWYKNKYESHLFKERKDLYNLTNFVKSAQAQKMPTSEILSTLKKEGWNSEQINYIMLKAKGGLFSKLFSKNK